MIIGPRTVIKENSQITNCYLMGNDFYHPPKACRLPHNLTIGKNCILDHAIIDKHVNIGDNVQLVNHNKLSTYNGKEVFIRDGIIVVPSGATIPSGFIL